MPVSLAILGERNAVTTRSGLRRWLAVIIHPIYTMPMQRIIRKHGVVYHKYADDTQLYVTYKPNVLGDMQRAVKQLEDCISEIRVWMINRMLKLNDNKTDMVIYMSQYHLNKYGRCDISIGDSTISPVECVRNLGVQIDQHLTMDKQVTAVCKACNFHLYRLSSIRRYITTDAARSVAQALITSRLDYCNSLLANLTNTQMKRLKSIQHKAARLVTRTPLREHITPVLKQLHWLPVECRITYKIMVLVYKCVNGTAPGPQHTCAGLFSQNVETAAYANQAIWSCIVRSQRRLSGLLLSDLWDQTGGTNCLNDYENRHH